MSYPASLAGKPRPASRPRCLWVAADCPWPPGNGTAVYSAGMLAATAAAGVEITVLCLAPENDGWYAGVPLPGVTWKFVKAERRPRRLSLVSPLPAMAFSTGTPALRAALHQMASGEAWDAVVIDHLQSGWAIDGLPLATTAGAAAPVVFISHNYETTARLGLIRMVGGPRAVALRWDAYKVGRLERRVVHAARAVTALTPEDQVQFERLAPKTAVILMKPGYDGPRLETRSLTDGIPRRAVVVGTFEWHVKQENLRRLTAAADPVFAEAGVELRVVGFVPDRLRSELSGALRATTFSGVVPSLAVELAQARVGIVAERFGGGFKMKALDYVFHRVPIAALAGNLAGLPLGEGSCLTFHDETSLASGVVSTIDNLPALNRLQQVAYEACRDHFDWSARGTLMRELIACGPSGDGNCPASGIQGKP